MSVGESVVGNKWVVIENREFELTPPVEFDYLKCLIDCIHVQIDLQPTGFECKVLSFENLGFRKKLGFRCKMNNYVLLSELF